MKTIAPVVSEEIYNYADDNTISRYGDDIDTVKILLEDATHEALDWFSCNEMQANPSKFQALVLGSNIDKTDLAFNIAGSEITPSKSVNLLGVEIDDKLDFSIHISKICKKAVQQLGALARLSKVLDRGTKMIIFNSFILSNFNYCPLVWHHCSLDSSKKMEKIQERGLRFVFNDSESSYNELLNKANKNLLYIERIKRLAVLTFKCKNQIGPASQHNIYATKDIPYNLRDTSKLTQPKANTSTYGLNSLKYSGAALWNTILPKEFKEISQSDNLKKLNIFQRLIKSWSGPSCTCGACNLCKISS